MEENKNEFKPCRSYNGYEVSRDGRVRVRRTGKELKISEFPNGVKHVNIVVGMYTKHKHYKKVKVGEMVARTYLRAKKAHEILHCKNSDWNDYDMSNYEWYDPQKLPENNTKSWKPIADTCYHYDVSVDGDVRSHKYCKPIKPYSHKGKPYVTLSINGKPRIMSVAKLVAAAFISNPKKHHIVGHKDGDVWNNSVDNLVWGMRDDPTVNHCLCNSKSVDEYSHEGEFIRTWKSMTAVARCYKVSPTSIKNACTGKYMTAAHKIWRFTGESLDAHRLPDIPELLPGEYFIPIPKSVAEVSNRGRVRSTLNSKPLYHVNKNGSVNITIDGKATTKRVYVLEATTMLPNPKGLKRVGFIDGDPTNWDLENLRWE